MNKKRTKKKVRLNFWTEEGTNAWLEDEAKKRGCSKTTVANMVLRERRIESMTSMTIGECQIIPPSLTHVEHPSFLNRINRKIKIEGHWVITEEKDATT